jgi:hypothetical protein
MRLGIPLVLAALSMIFAAAAPASVGAVALQAEASAVAQPAGPQAVSAGASSTVGSRAAVGVAAWTGRFSVYRPRTFSVQRANYTCVAASTQMMLNIIHDQHDRSRSNQITYWQYAQANSRYPVRDNGADPGGWAAALRHWGAGDYYVGAHSSRQDALRAAALRIRLTGKPAGLIVWGQAGGHAWVMTGFESTADPAATNDFMVSSVQATGPLWPYGTINLRPYDPGPAQWVGMAELQRKFTAYHVRDSDDWNGRWVTVLP